MNTIRLFIGIFSALAFLSGCGNQMTIVKAHPKSMSETAKFSDNRWKNSYNEGLAYYNKKEYSAALELFAVALKYTNEDDDETRGWLYFSIGRCWEGSKDLAKAEQNYIMAQNLDPNLTEASDRLARITKRRAQKE